MGLHFDVKIYDCTQVSIVYAGVPISKGPGASGYAEGVFLEYDQDGDDWGVKKGADGSLTRYCINEPVTFAQVHLMQTCASNAVFSGMRTLDVKGVNGAGIGTFSAIDLQGTSLLEAGKCWVLKPPKKGYGKEAGETIWPLVLAQVERLDGGN
jgi:hypothetical protein